MEIKKISQIFAQANELSDRRVTVAGWARTIRDMKNFGFIELNDGSSFKSLQVFMSRDEIDNYAKIA